MKTKKGRKGARTKFTIRAQASNAEAVKYWHGLTEDQRQAWKTAAAQKRRPDRLGNMRYLNGFQLFMTLPHDWGECDVVSWQDVPPLYATQQPDSIEVLNVQTGAVTLDASLWRSGSQDYVVMYAGRFRPGGSKKSQHTWVRCPMINVYEEIISFGSIMAVRDLFFVEGERVRLKFTLYSAGYWPIHFEMGDFTVV